VGKAAAPGLPTYIKSFYSDINVFQFGGITVHPACLSSYGPFDAQLAQFGAVLSMLFIVALLKLVYFGMRLNKKRLGQGTSGRQGGTRHLQLDLVKDDDLNVEDEDATEFDVDELVTGLNIGTTNSSSKSSNAIKNALAAEKEKEEQEKEKEKEKPSADPSSVIPAASPKASATGTPKVVKKFLTKKKTGIDVSAATGLDADDDDADEADYFMGDPSPKAKGSSLSSPANRKPPTPSPRALTSPKAGSPRAGMSLPRINIPPPPPEMPMWQKLLYYAKAALMKAVGGGDPTAKRTK
jgi:hypothetical protein